MTIEQSIDLLLDRLKWPSLLVKDRASNEIATLLTVSEYSELVCQKLLFWLNSQSLESVSVYGLLVLIRAIKKGAQLSISSTEVWESVSSPSLLAWALMRDTFPDFSIHSDKALIYTPTVPPDYEGNDFFIHYINNYIPPSYSTRAERIEARTGFPFLQSWAFEWDILIQKRKSVLSDQSLHYWMGHREDTDDYTIADTEISEIYKSAYLRTVARMVDTKRLPLNTVWHHVVPNTPIDLDLCLLEPNQRPSWWPQIGEQHSSEIDLSIATIWQQVENLWNQKGLNGKEKVLAHANGSLFNDEVIYDLEIFGLFQWIHGTEEPIFADLTNWCKESEDNLKEMVRTSPFHFSGQQRSENLSDSLGYFNDWSILSLAQRSNPYVVPRWQAWRMWRGIWVPNSALFETPVSQRFQKNVVAFYSGDRYVGEWRDWSDGLTERRNRQLPPQSGEYLTLERQFVQKSLTATDSTFCWLCSLTHYYREHKGFGPYKKFTDYRLFGGSHVLRA